MNYKITLLVLFFIGICHSQETIDNKVLVEDLGISFRIDSVEDLKELDLSEFKKLVEESEGNHPITLEILCDRQVDYGKATLNNTSFKIGGNSNDIANFMKRAQKLKGSVKKFYRNLNTK